MWLRFNEWANGRGATLTAETNCTRTTLMNFIIQEAGRYVWGDVASIIKAGSGMLRYGDDHYMWNG